jgi:replicative DNA helicase
MQITTDELEQVVPHSIEAEQALLASVLINPEIFADVRDVVPAAFFQPDHKIIFESIQQIAAEGMPPAMLLVREHLVGRGLLDDIGGNATLIRLARDTMPSGAHAGHYAAIVAEKYRLRQILQMCHDIIRRCTAPSRSIERAEVLATDLVDAAGHVRDGGAADSIRMLKDVLADVLESKGSGTAERIRTGLRKVDDLTGGLPVGGNTIVAGRSGMGKSTLVKQIARNAAAAGVTVGIVTVEESAKKIAENYLAGASGVQNSRIAYNRLDKNDWAELISATRDLARLPIFIDDSQQTLSAISRTIRRMVRNHDCRMIVVDHIHLIDGETDANRTQEITRISAGLKNLFKELNVAGVVAAQLNRGGGADHDAPPELWHLRDSGSLEQDGDLILQLYRADYFLWKKMGKDFQPDRILRIYCNKNKSGDMGWRDCHFDGDGQQVLDDDPQLDPFRAS